MLFTAVKPSHSIEGTRNAFAISVSILSLTFPDVLLSCNRYSRLPRGEFFRIKPLRNVKTFLTISKHYHRRRWEETTSQPRAATGYNRYLPRLFRSLRNGLSRCPCGSLVLVQRTRPRCDSRTLHDHSPRPLFNKFPRLVNLCSRERSRCLPMFDTVFE